MCSTFLIESREYQSIFSLFIQVTCVRACVHVIIIIIKLTSARPTILIRGSRNNVQKHFVTDYSICSNDLYQCIIYFPTLFIRQSIVYLFNGSMFLFHLSIHFALVVTHAHYARTCNGSNASHLLLIRSLYSSMQNPDRAPPEYTLPLPPTNFWHVIGLCVCVCTARFG